MAQREAALPWRLCRCARRRRRLRVSTRVHECSRLHVKGCTGSLFGASYPDSPVMLQDATQKITEAAEALERRQQLRELNLAPPRPGAARWVDIVAG